MMHHPGSNFVVSTLVFGGALLLPQDGRGAAAPRVKRVINNLQVIDFSIPQQTGESATLTTRMEAYKAPGVSIAVINDGAIEWARGFGVLKAGDTARVSEQSIFQAASVSKYVTAILVLHLVDGKRLDLDADVNRYLKTWKIPDGAFTKDKKVTLRYLLSHQAGMPNVDNVTQEEGQPEATLAQILGGRKPALTPPAVPGWEPGSRWSYSNIGYTVIQLLLEDVTGKPFPRLAEEVLFRPLGMSSSSFSYPLPEAWRKREAWPHDSNGHPRTPEQDGAAKTMGGLLTTPGDLALLTLDVVRAYQGVPNRIISPETARLLVTRQTGVPTEALGLPLSEGLGVFIDDTTQEVCFLHPGHNRPGTTFVVVAYPALGKGAVIGVNGNIGDRLHLEILAALAIEYGWPSSQPFKR